MYKDGQIIHAFAIIAVIMGILFLTALNIGLMKDLKKRKENSLTKRRKSHPLVLTTKTRLTVSRILITRIAQIILTVDMTIVETEINTITTIIINSMKISFPRKTSLVRMTLMRDNILNVRIKTFNVLIPQPYTDQFQTSSSKYHDQQPRSAHSVHWVKDQNRQIEYLEQINYTYAITDFFPLNF